MSIFYRADLNWNNKSSTWYSLELFNKGNIVKSIYQFLGASTITIACLTSANAQSKFDGFFGQLGVGYENVSPTVTPSPLAVYGLGNYATTSTVSSQSGFVGTATVGFYAPVSPDFLLGVGAEYSPFKLSSGTQSWTVYGNGSATANGTWQLQNSYNIYVSPATPVGTDGLLYGKVGYTGAQIQASLGSNSPSTTNYTGYSLGAGYKQIISGGLYGFGEFNYFKYGNQTTTTTGNIAGYSAAASWTSSANAYNLIFGIGYKF